MKDISEHDLESFKKINKEFHLSAKGIFETETENIPVHMKILDMNDFEKQGTISKNRYKKVYEIIDKRTGMKYVAKQINKKYLNSSIELNIIAQLHHPSVVKFIGYSPTSFKNKNKLVIVTEFCPNRTLEDILQLVNNNEDFQDWTETKKLICIYGIASVLSFLHSNKIAYIDLKPDNIILDEFLFPKLIDFDLAETQENAHSIFLPGFNDSSIYKAPEILCDENYDTSADVYSFSILLYFLVTNIRPFFRMLNVLKRKLEIELTSKIPKCYRDLIEKCWSYDPAKRPTFDEILHILKTNRDFITENVNEEEYRNYIKYIDESPKFFGYRPMQEEYVKKEVIKSNLQTNFYSFNQIDLSLYLKKNYKSKVLNVKANDIIIYNYAKQELIGRGSFGTVYKVKDKKTGNIYAAKISKSYLTQCSDDDVKNLEREINIISKLDHPGILKFIGYTKFNFNGKPKPTIITEIITNGSLEDILELERKSRGNPKWDDTKKLINIYGIASAMAYLHKRDIIHRDLKPANILLDDYLFPKISDFGLSKIIDDENNKLRSGFKGTYAYSSPEMFENIYSKAGDVYAFGIIVYEIITGDPPYNGISPFQLLTQVRSGTRPEFRFDIPKCYRELIESCWSNNPEKRPTFEEIVQELKNKEEFITENVNIDEFMDYVDYIDENQNQNNSVLKNFDPIYENSKIKIADLGEYRISEEIEEQSNFKKSKIINRKTKEEFMAKILKVKINKITKYGLINLTREVNFAWQITHPSFLKFIGYSPLDFQRKQYPVIITESASNGTLKDLFKSIKDNKENKELNDTNKLIIIYGIASGMQYLHSEGIIHRNLNPSNIYMDDKYHPKMTDLEYAKNVNENRKKENHGFLNIYSYAAPETFKCQYSKYSDVYSFGMIIYEIITNERIYDDIPVYMIQIEATKGFDLKFEEGIPEALQTLIEQCISLKPEERPTFDNIVEKLKNDPGFITSKVDINRFREYLKEFQQNLKKHIVHSKIKFSKKKDEKISSSDQTIGKEICLPKFNKVLVDFKEIKEPNDKEQIENMKESAFLDLSQFKLGDLISKQDYTKTYQLISKSNGTIYSGRISTIRMNKFSRDELINLSREVNIISQLCHPSFLKFIGYSPVDFKNKHHPIIVTEFVSNGTLKNIIESERRNETIPGWDETRKLINIYGIASGMEYLHSNNILHRDLNPGNIFVDDYLFPKIGDFGLSTKNHSSDTMTYQSTAGLKGNPTYSSPEILQMNEYTKSGDVYSYGFVIYEIITNIIPFEGIINKNEIFNEVVINNKRPIIPDSVPSCYRELIEKCWAQNASDRPTFKSIVDNLLNNQEFVEKNVNKEDFDKYVGFIRESRKEFENRKRILDLSEFIKEKSKITENTKQEDQNEEESEDEYEEVNKKENKSEPQRIQETETEINHNLDYKQIDENESKIKAKKIKEDANEKEFSIHHSSDINLYGEKTSETTDVIKEVNLEQKKSKQEDELHQKKINLKMLALKSLKENDTERTYLCMIKLIENGEFDIPIKYSIQLYKKNMFKASLNFFEILSKFNHPIAQYFIGEMKFYGKGCEINRQESYSIMKNLSSKGIDKAAEFIKEHF